MQFVGLESKPLWIKACLPLACCDLLRAPALPSHVCKCICKVPRMVCGAECGMVTVCQMTSSLQSSGSQLELCNRVTWET